jgi:Tfp pilus assembly protein PilO
MNTTRLWVLGGAVIAIALVAMGWFVGIAPKLADMARADASRQQAIELNEQNEIVLAELKEQFENLDELTTELEALQLAVPFTVDVPDFLRQLNSSAAATGVSISEITIDEARAYGAPPPVEPAAQPAEGDDVEAGAAAEPIPAAAPIAPPSVTDPRVSAANFVAVPVSVTVAGTYSAVQSFISAAQHGDRLFLALGMNLSPSDAAAVGSEAMYSGVINGFIYVLIDPYALEEAAAAELAAAEG